MTGSGDGIPRNAFHFLSSEELAGLLPLATSVIVEKGKRLFQLGEKAQGVYFLESGRLGVFKETGFNDKTQVVALLEPGASVGEGGALGKVSRTATIIAIEDSHLYHLGLESLDTLAVDNHYILIKILKRLLLVATLRLQKSSERLAHIL